MAVTPNHTTLPPPILNTFLRLHSAVLSRRSLSNGLCEYTLAMMQHVRSRLLDHHNSLPHLPPCAAVSGVHHADVPYRRVAEPNTAIDFVSPDIVVARTALEFALCLRGLTLNFLLSESACIGAVDSLIHELRVSAEVTSAEQQQRQRRVRQPPPTKQTWSVSGARARTFVKVGGLVVAALMLMTTLAIAVDADSPSASSIATKPTFKMILSDVASSRIGSALRELIHPHITVPIRNAPTPPTTKTEKQECLSFEASSRSGFVADEAIDSVVSVTFDTPYGSDPLMDVVAAMAADPSIETSEYYTFLAKRRAELRTESSGLTEAFAMDVVFTYVNPTAASYKATRATICREDEECVDRRFRDWDELQHSMRALYHRAMCTQDKSRCGESGNVADGALVRHIYIVVADLDHTPAWLDPSHPLVTIVTHKELFSHDEDALPTLNSHAIEAALHRIPGLSRYFVYFNNDMFFGRRLSFFDYFRPLSPWRQAQREASLSTRSVVTNSSRRTVMFEPIFYFDGFEDPNEFRLISRHSQPTDFLVHHLCSNHPLKASSFFDIACREPRASDHYRNLVNFNKNLIIGRIAGGWPSHSFAHYPQVLDRAILKEMQEVDFADVSRATRRQQLRTSQSLWTTYVYQYYAIGHRRAVAAKLDSSWRRVDTLDAPHLDKEVTFKDLAPGADESNGLMHGNDSIALPRHLSQRLVGQRVQRTVVVMRDAGEPFYYFAMLESHTGITKTLRELAALGDSGRHVFVTLNDDFPAAEATAGLMMTGSGLQLRAALEGVFLLVAGDSEPPPWTSPHALR